MPAFSNSYSISQTTTTSSHITTTTPRVTTVYITRSSSTSKAPISSHISNSISVSTTTTSSISTEAKYSSNVSPSQTSIYGTTSYSSSDSSTHNMISGISLFKSIDISSHSNSLLIATTDIYEGETKASLDLTALTALYGDTLTTSAPAATTSSATNPSSSLQSNGTSTSSSSGLSKSQIIEISISIPLCFIAILIGFILIASYFKNKKKFEIDEHTVVTFNNAGNIGNRGFNNTLEPISESPCNSQYNTIDSRLGIDGILAGTKPKPPRIFLNHSNNEKHENENQENSKDIADETIEINKFEVGPVPSYLRTSHTRHSSVVDLLYMKFAGKSLQDYYGNNLSAGSSGADISRHEQNQILKNRSPTMANFNIGTISANNGGISKPKLSLQTSLNLRESIGGSRSSSGLHSHSHSNSTNSTPNSASNNVAQHPPKKMYHSKRRSSESQTNSSPANSNRLSWLSKMSEKTQFLFRSDSLSPIVFKKNFLNRGHNKARESKDSNFSNSDNSRKSRSNRSSFAIVNNKIQHYNDTPTSSLRREKTEDIKSAHSSLSDQESIKSKILEKPLKFKVSNNDIFSESFTSTQKTFTDSFKFTPESSPGGISTLAYKTKRPKHLDFLHHKTLISNSPNSVARSPLSPALSILNGRITKPMTPRRKDFGKDSPSSTGTKKRKSHRFSHQSIFGHKRGDHIFPDYSGVFFSEVKSVRYISQEQASRALASVDDTKEAKEI